jgi:DNA (cytosine-5)-methyltransferase 1
VDTAYSVDEALAAPLNGARFVSLYSGCGGLDLGFRMAGFEPIWANDTNKDAVATYAELLGGEHVLAGSISAVELPETGAAELVIGGPPCQGFSVAGKMDPDDPRSEHVMRFMDVVEHVRPSAFVMENVKALAESSRWASVRERLRSRAEELGFVVTILVLRAADFGVPQRRDRMFFIGMKDAKPPETIEPTIAEPVSVEAALAELPPFGEPGNDTECPAVIVPAKKPVLRPTAYRGSLLFNGNGRPLKLDLPAPTLPASMGGNATPIVDQLELDTGEESWIVSYHRLLVEGGEPAAEAPSHLRRITVEEAARIQGFPTGMAWHGKRGAQFRQIGNAVPPPLAHAVACAVAEALGLEAAQPLQGQLRDAA